MLPVPSNIYLSRIKERSIFTGVSSPPVELTSSNLIQKLCYICEFLSISYKILRLALIFEISPYFDCLSVVCYIKLEIL